MEKKRRRFNKIEDRLDAYINKTDTCWLWTGDLFGSGYGRLSIGGGKQIRAHRYIYEQKYGVIPEDMCALHKCDVRNCVNPDHLYIGDKKDNMQDCLSRGRHKYITLRGTDSPNSKTSKEDVEEIKRMWATGNYYQREIGEKFGISQVSVSRILLGYSYNQ